MPRTLVNAERIPRTVNGRTDCWYYVGRGECSFHLEAAGGRGVHVPTRSLRKALGTMDRQLRRQRRGAKDKDHGES